MLPPLRILSLSAIVTLFRAATPNITTALLLAPLLFASFLMLMGLAGCSSQRRIIIPAVPSIQDAVFYRTVSGISRQPLLDGNRVAILNTGRETLQTLYGLLAEAQKSINIETYILEDDSVGRSISNILIRQARQGVKVNLIIDAVGGRRIGGLPEKLREAGIKLYFFNEFSIYKVGEYNHRTHRKLIIIDGKIGITGGFGLSERWNEMGEIGKFRDLQMLLEGPAVAQMQSAFIQHWFELSDQILTGEDYFPELLPKGNVKARLIDSRPYGGSSSIQQLYIFALNTARDYFWMESGYFVPEANSLQALKRAAQRGVDVHLILPHIDHTDIRATVYAGRQYYDELLEAGVNIHEFTHQSMHAKFAVADDRWVTLGSANFDNRGFKINREANLDIYDASVAQRMKAIFRSDLERGKALQLDSFRQRSFFKKIPESFYNLFEEYL